MVNIIYKYFPNLTDEQKAQYAKLDELYRDWNAKINVISRKDIDNLYEHHVLHSLAIAKALHFKPGTIGLKNLTAEHLRGEDEKGKFDFIVSRAVMPLPDMVKIVRKNVGKEQRNAMPNGIFCLKGGDLQSEIHPFRNIVEQTDLTSFFTEEWFKEKHLVYLPV